MIGYGNSMFLATHGILARSASGAAVDPDAQAFITAASITDPTQQSAINQLVVDLKGYSIWTKMKALYPFVGGTSTTHKWNLKDPRDLDAAFRLVFNGGVTHTSNGIQGNGTNGYAQTFLVPNTYLTLNNSHLSVYSRSNNQGDFMDIGVNDEPNVLSNAHRIQTRWSDGSCYYSINSNTGNGFSTANSLGFYIANRVNSTNQKLYKNNSINTGSSNANSLSSKVGGIFICAWNHATPYYSPRQYAFASIGDGLTDAEAANFYTAVQAFQTTLGRNV